MNQLNSSRRNGPNYNRGHSSNAGQTIKPADPVKFYVDSEKKRINADLVDSIAEQQAEKMHDKISPTQLRRFFGEVKDLFHRMQSRQDKDFEQLLPLIKMIKSKVYYAFGRKQETKIPSEFVSFLLGGIDQIRDQKDFEAFVLYFEAVVGFMYGKGLVKK